MEKYEIVGEGFRRVIGAEKMYVNGEIIYLTQADNTPIAFIPVAKAICVSKLGSQVAES